MHRTNHIPLPKFSTRKFSHHLKFDRVERVSYAIAKNMIAFDRERRGGGGGSLVSENFVRERLERRCPLFRGLRGSRGNLRRVERFAGTGPLI